MEALFTYSEDYDEESATAHVRRVLDIVACTTSFGASPSSAPAKDQSLKPDASGIGSGKLAPGAQDKSAKKSGAATKSPGSPGTDKRDVAVDSDAELSHSCLKLGSFYDFFSLAHLTPPLQCKPLSHFLFTDYVCI